MIAGSGTAATELKRDLSNSLSWVIVIRRFGKAVTFAIMNIRDITTNAPIAFFSHVNYTAHIIQRAGGAHRVRRQSSISKATVIDQIGIYVQVEAITTENFINFIYQWVRNFLTVLRHETVNWADR